MRLSGGGLRFRLTSLLVIALLPLVVVIGVFVSTRYDVARREGRGEIEKAAEMLKARHDIWLARTEGFLTSLSSVLTATTMDGTPQCDAFQRALATTPESFANVVVADSNGDIKCSAEPIPGGISTNVADRPSFKAVRDGRSFQVLTLGEGLVLGHQYLPIAFPWLDGDRFLGVIFAPVELGELSGIIRSVAMPEGSSATVYDQGGTVAARNVDEGPFVGTDQSDQEAFVAASDFTKPSSFEAKGLGGVRRLYATSFVEHVGSGKAFIILVGTPVSVVYKGANQLRAATIVGVSVLVALVVIASFTGAHLLVLRPISALQGVVRRLADGDMSARPGEIKGAGELRALGVSFGDMTEALQDRATKLETSERRFRTMIETIPAATFLVSAEGERFKEMSIQITTLLGIDPALILADPQIAYDRIGEGDLLRWRAAIDECLELETSVGLDIAFQRADETWGWLRTHIRPSRNADGSLLGFQGVAFDISDRVEAQHELAQMNAVLEERVKSRTAELSSLNLELVRLNNGLMNANEELEAFSYSVSHDLRAPLRGISGFAQLLEMDHAKQLDEEGLRLLGRVQGAAMRMGVLIDDLLGLTQVGKSSMSIEQINLTQMAHEVVESLAASDPGRSVKVDIQDGLIAYGDHSMVRVLLDNLLGNAWKFTGKKSVAHIELGASSEPDEPRWQVFFLRDNGAGFDVAYVDKIFHPFQRLHTVEEFEGTGIGLAIVNRIIVRHGGRVWATSELGKGTTVFFQMDQMPNKIESSQ